MAAVGYETPGLRTSGERVMVSRMTEEFASVASDDGTVEEISDSHIRVLYKDGSVKNYPLGNLITTAEGTYYPNLLKTQCKVGDKLKKGDVVCYNSGFFKPSPLDKNRVDYMTGCVGRIALREAMSTLEDSCALSEDFAKRLGTYVVKKKTVKVDFNQNVSGVAQIGDDVDLFTSLLVIEDDPVGTDRVLDEATVALLKQWVAKSPTAGCVGKIIGMECYYNGDIDDMSPSLQQIVMRYERNMKREAKKFDKAYIPSLVDRNIRIDKYNVEPNQLVIMFSINVSVGMGIADKLVFFNQMKSTVGDTLVGINTTLDGTPIDGVFGPRSLLDRIATSPFKIGTTNTLLRYIGEEAHRMYFDK